MKIHLRLTIPLVVLVVGLGVKPARGGPEEGLPFYRAHQYDEAIQTCRDEKDFQSRLVMGLASAEKFGLYKNKADKEQSSIYLKVLAVDVRLEHLSVIEPFLNTEGAPYGNKEAARLFERALRDVRSPEDVLRVTDYLAPERGAEINRIALLPILKRLKPVREYVGKGGSMPDVDRNLFTDSRLLTPLVAALGRKETERLARSCLVVIEEPALPYLEQGELTKATSEAIVGIKKAMANRLKKHPDSTWYSAYGR